MKYTNQQFTYTNPQAYDDRVKQPIEKFIAACWNPILLKYLHDNIKEGVTVADLGCGTFIHTQHMGKAKHIYAVDINQQMLEYGQPKIQHLKDKITVLCESGTHTSIPSASCDVVWIDGLSEFLNLDDLFREVSRILKNNGTFIILYQNKIHPENSLVALYYWLTNRPGKKYRTLNDFKTSSQTYNFTLANFQSTAIYAYLPAPIQVHAIWLWQMITKLYQPLQQFYPLGNNIICEFRKKDVTPSPASSA